MFETFNKNNKVQKLKKETGETFRKEILPGFVELYEIRERTNNLERGLEENKATEKARKKNVAERIVEGLKNQGQKMARIAMLLTALGLPGFYQKEATAETLKTEERQQIILDTGIDVFTIAEVANFDTQLQVPSQNGKYILHIGQSHYVKGYEDKVREAHAIAQVQRGIEKILRGLAENGNREIFNEGYTQELRQEYPNQDETPKRLRKFIESVIASKECFDILANESKKETQWFIKGSNLASDSLALRTKELFKKKAFELKKELESVGQFDEKMKESFIRALEEFKPNGTLSKLGDDAIYLIGIENQLEWEGIIKILPAETKQGNKGAFKYEQELKIARSNYFNADFNKISLEEIRVLAKIYNDLKRLDYQATMDDREDIAVAIIGAESKSKTNWNLIPLLFGSAHDFKNNVEDFNALKLEKKFGLIRLIPREDKTPPETKRDKY